MREKDLAQVRLSWLVEQIVAKASRVVAGRIGEYGYGWGKPAHDKTAVADIRRVRSGRSRMSQERLSKIVEIYREHINDRPTEAVERAFGVSHRTAARYVQQARDAGLLPATTPGKKKA